MVGNWKFKPRGLIYGLVGTLPLMSNVALLKSLRELYCLFLWLVFSGSLDF